MPPALKGRASKRKQPEPPLDTVPEPPPETVPEPNEAQVIEDPVSPQRPTTTTTSPAAGRPGTVKLQIGHKVLHRLMQVNGVVVQFPAAADFMHAGKVCIRYLTTEKKVQVLRTMWCWPSELDVVWTSPRRAAATDGSQQRVPERVKEMRPFERAILDVDEDLREGAEGRPELADHERARVLPQKQAATKGRGMTWGLCGERRTHQTSVSLEERIAAFPSNSFKVAPSPTGKVLFCQCCPKTIQNILGTIKTHIASDRHKERLKNWMKRGCVDDTIREFLHEYFAAHPREKDSSVGVDEQVYRWRVVEACLGAGIPLEKIDSVRTVLERGGVGLTHSSHLKLFIPKIEGFEMRRLIAEVKDQPICLIYDGSTRLGECTAVLMRWCSAEFEIEQRVIALRTVKKHMSGDTLGPFLIDVIGQLGVRSSSIVCLSRDSCATNGKAERNIKPILSNSESMMCISHTLSHCAEHVDLPTLKAFMTPWLSLVQHHSSAKSLWKELLGGSAMKGFSNIRWFSREECCNELAENFSLLPDFVDRLVQDEIGDAHPKKMQEILSASSLDLQAELACNLDMKPVLTTCYSLEGDGLGLLLAAGKLDALFKWGETLGSDTASLRNVAALLRSRIELEPGVKIREFFADVQPARWFTGVLVQPRVEGLVTVKYSDGSKIDQEAHEARKWIEIADLPEWKRLVSAAKEGIQYLHNRLHGNLPAGQVHYDCSYMFEVLCVEGRQFELLILAGRDITWTWLMSTSLLS